MRVSCRSASSDGDEAGVRGRGQEERAGSGVGGRRVVEILHMSTAMRSLWRASNILDDGQALIQDKKHTSMAMTDNHHPELHGPPH